VLLGHTTTQQRGVELLTDLADQLLPGKTTTTAQVVGRTPVGSEAVATPKGVVIDDTKPVPPVVTKPKAPVPPAPVAEKPVPPAPKAAPVAPPAPAATMTPEELNAALVVEYKRLGSRDAIDNAMAELGVTSVTALLPEQYQPLLDSVKSIQ